MNLNRPAANFSPLLLLLRRLLALGYDILALTGLLMVMTLPYLALVYGATGTEAIPAGSPGFRLYLAVIITAYFVASWHWGGQTLGMRAWRLFATYNGTPGLPWRACLWRIPAGLAGVFLAGMGYWWSLWDTQERTWSDLASGAVTQHRAKPTKLR